MPLGPVPCAQHLSSPCGADFGVDAAVTVEVEEVKMEKGGWKRLPWSDSMCHSRQSLSVDDAYTKSQCSVKVTRRDDGGQNCFLFFFRLLGPHTERQ